MQTNKIIKVQEKKRWIHQMCKQTGEKYWLLHCNLVCNVEYGLNIFVLLHLQAVLLIKKLVFVFAALMKTLNTVSVRHEKAEIQGLVYIFSRDSSG